MKDFAKILKDFENSDAKILDLPDFDGSVFDDMEGILVPVSDDVADPMDEKPVLKDKYKHLTTVLAVYHMGGPDVVLQKIEDSPELGLGTDDEEHLVWYGLGYTWGVFDPKEVSDKFSKI